ncbi:MAG: NADH-quinone oxidoreductase subunit C [Candidatus Omnitrophica bacterium]|nr:NADH-quinone oxidoreductase subunit C [Candidatus Omnitrophota bacterium]
MILESTIKERLSGKIISWSERSPKRIYFSIKPDDILEVVTLLFKELRLRFATASGYDTTSGIEILYHFSFDKEGTIFSVRVLLEDKKKLEIDSISNLFKGAEWIEREIWELLGVNFKSHPNLKHLLLIDDWPEGKHPLRHDEHHEHNHKE